MSDRDARIAEALKSHDAQLLEAQALFGGACQENVRVDISLGGARQRLVLRSDARSTLPGSIDRQAEFEVIQAVRDAGVKTPDARWLTPNLLRPQTHAYFLDWVSGEAIGRRVVKSGELADARRSLGVTLARQLALIHSVTPENHALRGLPVPEQGPAAHALETLTVMLRSIDGDFPSIELGLRWLRQRLPTDDTRVLVHGDFRTGNFMVSPRGLEGILDWEFAHWGSRYEDLAWVSVRDWRFNQLEWPIGGFEAREPFYQAYREASGHTVDRTQIHWWEIFGNLRWAVGSLFQGKRYLRGDDRDLELIAIAKRHTEMEYEALRLMQKGAL